MALNLYKNTIEIGNTHFPYLPVRKNEVTYFNSFDKEFGKTFSNYQGHRSVKCCKPRSKVSLILA